MDRRRTTSTRPISAPCARSCIPTATACCCRSITEVRLSFLLPLRFFTSSFCFSAGDLDASRNEFCSWCSHALADYFFGLYNELDGSTKALLAKNKEFKELGEKYGFIKVEKKEANEDEINKELTEKEDEEEEDSDESGGHFYDKTLLLCYEAVVLANDISMALVEIYYHAAVNNRDQFADQDGNLKFTHADRLRIHLDNLSMELRTPGSIVAHTHFAVFVDIVRACLTPQGIYRKDRWLYNASNDFSYFNIETDHETFFIELPDSNAAVFKSTVDLFNELVNNEDIMESLAEPLYTIGFDIYGSSSLLRCTSLRLSHILFVAAVDRFAPDELANKFKKCFSSLQHYLFLKHGKFVKFTPPKERPSTAPLDGYTWKYLPQVTTCDGEHVRYIFNEYSEGYVLFYVSPYIR